MLNCRCDLAFGPLGTQAPLPVPLERLRLTIIPGNGPGDPSGSSICPGNSAYVTSAPPAGVYSPVCGDDVPLKKIDRVAPCAAGAAHKLSMASEPDNSVNNRGLNESLNFIGSSLLE